jgi:hypothetical protein
MAVAHDITAAVKSLAGVSSASWSHTATGSDRYGRVGLGFSPNTTTITSITWGGVAMTLVGSRVEGPPIEHRCDLYGIVAPAASAQTIAVSFGGGGFGAYGAAGSSSYTGVHQTTPSGAAFTAGSNQTLSVSVTVTDSVAGDMVSDVIKEYQIVGAPTAGAGQTQRWSGDDGTYQENAAASDEPGAASVVMSWTGVSTSRWTQVAAAIKQSGGSPPPEIVIQPTSGLLTFAASAPTLRSGVGIQPGSGVLALTPGTPTLRSGVALSIASGALALTPSTPTVRSGVGVAPTSAALQFTGSAPAAIRSGVGINPTSGVLALTPGTPSLSFGGGFTLAVTSAVLQLFGGTPTIRSGVTLTPTSGLLRFLSRPPTIIPSTATLKALVSRLALRIGIGL